MSNESGAVLTEQGEATERDSSAAMTMEDYLHYESEAFKTPNHGDIVDGIVVRVDADEEFFRRNVELCAHLRCNIIPLFDFKFISSIIIFS